MRINFVHRSGLGQVSGGFRIVAAYAKAMQAKGHDVTLVSPALKKRRLLPGPIGRRLPLYKAREYDTSLVDGAGLDLRMLDEARPVTDADLPPADVTVACWWTTVAWVERLSPSKGAKAHLVQGDDPAGAAGMGYADRVRDAFCLPIPKIAVSSWLSDRLTGAYGVDPDLVRVVPNGVAVDRFDFGDRARPDPPTVGVVWSGGAKRAELAAEAVLRLRGQGRAVRLVGFGTGAPTGYEAAFDSFTVRPPQDAIPGIYGACTAWMFPSKAEGFGLPILEAMASGTPVVGTRAGAAPDLIDGENGLLVDGTPEAMASGVDRVLSLGGDAWQAMSRAARRTAEANSLEAAADRFEAALEEIVAASRQS